MKATNVLLNDDHSIFGTMIHLAHAALVPSAQEAWDRPVAGGPRWLARLDRWAAAARQRDRERFLAESADVFDLERRLQALDRRPYF